MGVNQGGGKMGELVGTEGEETAWDILYVKRIYFQSENFTKSITINRREITTLT